MCSANLEYQLINPTTQVSLYSICIGTCPSLVRIEWTIYEGQVSAKNFIEWNVWYFRRSPLLNEQYFGNFHAEYLLDYLIIFTSLGYDTSNFTVTKRLFLDNPSIEYWRFEATYIFSSENSSSALNFRINQPPDGGFCSIDPQNGTTTTHFTIMCSNWSDADGIKDYSIFSKLMPTF